MGIPIHKALKMSRSATEPATENNERYSKIDESLDEILVNNDEKQEEPDKEKQVSFDSVPIITISQSENEKTLPKMIESEEAIAKSMTIINKYVFS